MKKIVFYVLVFISLELTIYASSNYPVIRPNGFWGANFKTASGYDDNFYFSPKKNTVGMFSVTCAYSGVQDLTLEEKTQAGWQEVTTESTSSDTVSIQYSIFASRQYRLVYDEPWGGGKNATIVMSIGSPDFVNVNLNSGDKAFSSSIIPGSDFDYYDYVASDSGIISVDTSDSELGFDTDLFAFKYSQSKGWYLYKESTGDFSDGSLSFSVLKSERIVFVVGSSQLETGNYDILFSGPIKPRITITKPSGNKNWFKGSVKEIKWNFVGNVGSYVKIELYKNGSFNRVLIYSTNNDGSYNWSIPNYQETGSDYKIKITSKSDSSCYDYSNIFTIKSQNHRPNKPICISPISIVESLTPTLVASTFHDPDGDSHQSTIWQIATDSSFLNIIWTKVDSDSDKISEPVPENILSSSKKYYWNVTYRDSKDAYSFTSVLASFTTPVYHTISTSSNPSGGGITSGGGSRLNSSLCTLTATSNNGYLFKNWTENGTVVSSTSSYSFTVTQAHSFVANFSPEATVDHLEIYGSSEVNENSDAQYNCKAFYSDGSEKFVTQDTIWSENSSYANFNSTIKGELRTGEVVSSEPVIITASYDGKSKTYQVTIKDVPSDQVATPIVNPQSGTYTSSLNISADCPTSGATIRYTTNNSEPNSSSSVWSNHSVTLPATLKFKAFKSGWTASTTVTRNYQKDNNPQTYTLTVNNGSGSGLYVSGATATVVANTAPNGQVFKKWTGSTAYIADVNSSSTTITMPSQNITVSATYKSGSTNITEFFEDWETGVIDSTKWKVWGSPQPTIVSGGNSLGSYALTSNGDANYESGVTSFQSFNVRPGLMVSAKMFVQEPGTSVWSKRSWHGLQLSSRVPSSWDNYRNAGDDTVGPFITIRGNTPTDTGVSIRTSTGGKNFASDLWLDKWVDVAFRFNKNGSVTYFLNNNVLFTTVAGWINYNTVPVAYLVVGGRSEGASVLNLHDNIKVVYSAPSKFKVTSFERIPSGESVLHWSSEQGLYYSIFWTDDLEVGFTPIIINLEYPVNSYTDSVHSTESKGFYKMKVDSNPVAP